MSDWKKTTCVLCAVNCGLEVQTDGNLISNVRPDKESPRSQGYACRKGLSIAHFQNNTQRLKRPLKRVSGSFEEISWEQAIDEISAKLEQLIARHGPKCLAYMGGGGQGCHFEAAFGTRLLRGLGSRYHYSALAQELTGFFYVQGEAYGRQYIHPFPDIEKTDILVLWGSNAWRSHGMNRARPELMRMAKDPNKLLIVIDPCKTDTAARANIHLAPRPGTDTLLLKAMIAILLDDRIYDEEFVQDHAAGFGEILRLFGKFDITAALEVCGLDEDKVRHLVHLLAGNTCSFRSDLGLLMGRNSTLNSYFEMILLSLLGVLGRRGGNVFLGHMVPLGTHTPVESPDNWRTVATNFPAIMGVYPPNVMPEEILSEDPERLRAVIVSGSNPLRMYADTSAYELAFKHLDLLVTVEVAMTETAALSHYVLPAKSAYEKWDGSFFSWKFPEYYFHLRRPVCAPLGEPKEEAEIYTRLADSLGLIPQIPPELERAAAGDRADFAGALMNFLAENPKSAEMLPFILAKTLGKTLGSAALSLLWGILFRHCQSGSIGLERAGYKLSPNLANQLFDNLMQTPGDLLISVQDVETNLLSSIRTSDKKVHLHIPALDEWVERITPEIERNALQNSEFPLVLAAGERTDFNANSLMRNPEWTGGVRACTVKIHQEDAERLGLRTGAPATVETAAGKIVLPVEISDVPHPGMAIIPHGFGLDYEGSVDGANVNYLAPARNRDPVAGTPLHKYIPCRISAG
ncbi:MAG: molybdopterin dinucleotide-binding protein [Candidatus Abyssobacteria bacterium SURF_5]|uniref:Molybdopterin dinucleotide-binding protein n=1 Tax=Abyssobacteria bacterium (strain SURF_5) TaxID=2093360 RepID=A0A3A4N5I4_ABYX5|nr:MAG: molybdopterin dinucleotide-binding protein [Candidatus Abyssubacteria bacterium SURF_5]